MIHIFLTYLKKLKHLYFGFIQNTTLLIAFKIIASPTVMAKYDYAPKLVHPFRLQETLWIISFKKLIFGIRKA